MVQHAISLKSWTDREIREVIDLGLKVKKTPNRYSTALKGKTMTMLFQKTSTRTRASFEVGMFQLGGHAMFLDWMTTQLGMSSLEDETRVLCRYSDVIMARLKKNEDVDIMAKVSTVPVINGCDDKFHPCQALADVMTIKEVFGKTDGLKLVYLGIANNVSNSLSLAATAAGMDFVLCVPERHPPSLDHDLLDRVNSTEHYSENKDVKTALKGADFVYTDTWVDMELFNNPEFKEEKERRMKAFLPYQINGSVMKAAPKAKIMHDMPMHIGYEITREAVESDNSIIFQQAENRLHAQKALLIKLIGREER